MFHVFYIQKSSVIFPYVFLRWIPAHQVLRPCILPRNDVEMEKTLLKKYDRALYSLSIIYRAIFVCSLLVKMTKQSEMQMKNQYDS